VRRGAASCDLYGGIVGRSVLITPEVGMARAASQDIVVLGSRRKARLEAIARRPSSPQSLVRRARIVLLAHQGCANARIAAELGCSGGTVRTWRRRFVRDGIPALADRPRSGRPEVYGPDVRLAIVATATSAPPDGEPAWTHDMIAGELAGTGISASQAGRILAGLRRPGSRPSTAAALSSPPGRAGRPAGNSSTSATAPSPSSPRWR
jgi:transposase